ncbi:putative aminotransferase DegT family [Herbaspirillum sp. GW103]|jgi:UDP-4-amino-4,6-dideoxy-N-acetyl-beta-L-altrosamine transaminase|uniref:UDP-4-amino-4, 6-dideoxy-N-acetyl-beta-L-altrosamine transaminase n=1 Tax=unclassified Herbaspirillum TaxID=2624150 RepID=UPI00025E4178|nr:MULTISPECIES: UDP-4-amino-4,6-dideoxy-N-acetyl-beta-L-altrosamine transaminase [unclassified Herbaspirillum]EIJ45486.1 putative aminotransferase DegT family [Herbaspirillum sp. GW103]MCI1004379.1 UDP-4-amino-4,6-dideoxy-N-acetyl-beta-L-altrosamine transaminase [Herbaspirillum sp. C7C8]
MTPIPYGRQDVTQDDIDAVVEILRSDFLTQGPAVPAFEQTLQAHCQASHAVAFSNATAALHIACRALEVGPGDLVWTSPITFVASANCALYCGAEVDFVDIDPRTWNMDPQALAAKLEQASRSGRLPKVVIPVHLCGQSCDMRAIGALAAQYGFKVIEDASHAIGGTYAGEPIGNCRHSDITVFSFHPVKIITTGEGGAALTRSDLLASRLRLLRSHGITREAGLMQEPPHGDWYYEQIDLGFNYRMTDMQAALGSSQAKRLEQVVAQRHRIAQRYDSLLADLPLQLPWQLPQTYSGMHLYVVLVGEQAGRDRKAVFDGLRADGILVNVHYLPVYRQPYYRQRVSCDPAQFPHAEHYYAHAISLPMYPGLSEAQQDFICERLAFYLA